jgi:branched-chain amino acid transport system ATP-binding protein
VSTVLALEGVNTFYGNSHVLQGVSLEIKSGEVVCLLGRNGAGKSTTVSSIIGFVQPRHGRILFNGVDITAWPVERRASEGLALVPQGRRVFPTLTVVENLGIGARPKAGGWTLERVYEFFPRLQERRRSLGGELSGGEQQMLAIGRALMANPALVLMDEPSEGLAPLVIEEMYRVIGALAKQGMSIFLVEHSLEQAISLANDLFIMNKGRIVFQSDDPGALTDEVRHKFLGVG